MTVKTRELVRLKKIEIYGFKSFADKTELEFNPGVTAVVGPNGCGKSNIADAFRWVLGEQSAKSMRGSKMPDVIFAGTTHRKPLNFAEVTITLCNECGLLPIEFSEVAVTRRLHRNGESDYFINRNQVRMKDIQSLFLDSGMGKNTFSIFEQGKIDQVINYTALERRYIFEEAAGILRFLQRKREALRKLDESEHNTARVKDIHKEEEKQIAVLQEQAEKARIYKDNKATLETLEKSVYIYKWDGLSRKKGEIEEKELYKKNDAEQVRIELEEEAKQLSLAKTDLITSEQILKKVNEDYFKAKSDKEIKSLEKKTNQERLKELSAKQKSLKNELESWFEKRKLRTSEFKQTLSRQIQIELEYKREDEKLKAKRESLTALEVELNKLRDAQQRAQAEVLKLIQLENQLESELKQHLLRSETQETQKAQNILKKLKLESLIEEFSGLIIEKKKELDQTSESIDKRKNVLNELEDTLQDISIRILEMRKQYENSAQEIAELKARQNALNRLKEDMEGFSSGSKRLLQESEKSTSPLFKKLTPLYKLIKPKTGGEQAVAASLKVYAETFVVKNRLDFDEIQAFAKKENLGSFSLICLEMVTKAINDGDILNYAVKKNIIPLVDLVSKSELASHLLQSVWRSQNNESAWQLMDLVKDKKFQIFSEEGSYIDANRVVFYGTESEGNSFLREAELENLEMKLENLNTIRLDLEKSLKSQEMQKSQIQLERIELDKLVRKEEMKLVEINFGLQRVQNESLRYNSEKREAEQELISINASLNSLHTLITETRQKHIESKLKTENVKNSGAALTEKVNELTASYKKESTDTQLQEAAFQKIVEENRKLIHALNVFEIKDMESGTQENRIADELESAREMEKFILSKGDEFHLSLEILEKALDESLLLCSKFESEVLNRKNKIGEFEKNLLSLQAKLKKFETEKHQAGLSLVETGSYLKSLENELQERYQLTIEELKALNMTFEQSLDQMEKQIRFIKQEIDEAGDINMTSIEQLTKHQARYTFLNEQLDDLNHSKEELIQIITELDKESRKIFKETFEVIRLNFQKNFKILFNGGEADLEFTESGDILEAGIEISAKPPGKQMRSISLLSGGEKCLTAMALLFAIFEVKPAPFCILDEIDAPLDDSNVERFVNVVKQFIDRCQFIVITHNKRTMAIADVLFGVSMEEKGVSKLLSLEFTKNEQ
jgi:chromosome segregation protein